MRKSQPLDTEFKNIMCAMSGLMLWLKIQEGNERIRKKELIQLGAAISCVMRGVTDISSSYSHVDEPEDGGDEP